MPYLTYTQIQQIDINKIKEIENRLYFLYENKNIDFENQEIKIDEGVIKSLIGMGAGVIAGPTVGKLICKVLGIEKGLLYNFLTSSIVGGALGLEIGKASNK